MMLTLARLRYLLEYDADTGIFTNRITRGPRAIQDTRAGSQSQRGYRDIKVEGTTYREHHLAWYYVHGEWPCELDHKDGKRDNNSIGNLRLANGTQNNFNADRAVGASGLRGAYFDYRTSNWYSQIKVGGQIRWLGIYGSALEAHIAFVVVASLYHGEFAFRTRKAI